MILRIGKFDVTVRASARRRWNEIVYRSPWRGQPERTWHLVWWKLSIYVEDATEASYAFCAECDSDEIGEVSAGDEGWTVCRACRSVEQGYVYRSKRELEARGEL